MSREKIESFLIFTFFSCFSAPSLRLLRMAAAKKSSSSSKMRSTTAKEAFGKKVKGENFYRDAKKVNRLKMMNGGKPVYNREGKIVEAAAFQKTEAETKPGRVQPDRRWFGTSIRANSKEVLI